MFDYLKIKYKENGKVRIFKNITSAYTLNIMQ